MEPFHASRRPTHVHGMRRAGGGCLVSLVVTLVLGTVRAIAVLATGAWRAYSSAFQRGSRATQAAMVAGPAGFVVGAVLVGLDVGILLGALAAATAWLAVRARTSGLAGPGPLSRGPSISTAPRAGGHTPPGPSSSAGSPRPRAVGPVVHWELRDLNHGFMGRRQQLTVAIDAPDGVHVVELRGRHPRGLLDRQHVVEAPPGRPDRVRRVHRLWNHSMRCPITMQ